MAEYTKQQRRLIVHALKVSKKYLWNGQNYAEMGWYAKPRKMEGICQALMAAEAKHLITRKTSLMVRTLISKRLGGAIWLKAWLRAQGVPEGHMSHVRLQAHRLAWMDKLIEEFDDA